MSHAFIVIDLTMKPEDPARKVQSLGRQISDREVMGSKLPFILVVMLSKVMTHTKIGCQSNNFNL